MDFTTEEKDRINVLYGTGFEDITPEDAELIGRWEAWKAVNDANIKAENEAREELSALKIKQCEAQHEYAMETLREMRDHAKARLERVGDE